MVIDSSSLRNDIWEKKQTVFEGPNDLDDSINATPFPCGLLKIPALKSRRQLLEAVFLLNSRYQPVSHDRFGGCISDIMHIRYLHYNS